MPDADALAVVAEFVEAEFEKRRLKEELTKVERSLKSLKEQVLTVFEKSGVQNMTMDGMTVYLSHQIAARLKEDRSYAVGVVRGWAPELVKEDFNMNQVSALFREQFREGGMSLADFTEELPAAIRECFDVNDWFDVRAKLA